jgi:4-hydroxy-4-methyl-2-oxoglutarate aldolase
VSDMAAPTTDLERINRYRAAAYGGAVCDSLARLGVRDTILSQRFHPLTEGAVLVGRAITVRTHTKVTPPEQALRENVPLDDDADVPQRRVMQAVHDAPDGSVLVYDTGGDEEMAHFGELSATLARSHGARGLLMSGNVRDVRHIREVPDFDVFTVGTCPAEYGGWDIIGVNEPIDLPGHLTRYVAVHPGDFIFGDADGVLIVPASHVDEVLLRVEQLASKETRERSLLAAGMPVADVYREIGIL